jgi:hypothetical protein
MASLILVKSVTIHDWQCSVVRPGIISYEYISLSRRSVADRSGTEITEYHSYMYAESHGTR